MACAFPEIDLGESYEECSACLEECEEPKQLPRLHRYCSECLTNLVEVDSQGTFECPLCNQECSVLDEATCEDIELKQKVISDNQVSLKSGQVKTCISCSQKLAVTAFCFKCSDYLCDECYQVHVSSKMFTDHQEHLINVSSIEEESARQEKLASNLKKPKCHFHARNAAEVCCTTCGNVPICKACTLGDHKDHHREDAKILAKLERDQLKEQLAELENYKEKLYNLPKMVEEVRQRLQDNDKDTIARLIEQHEHQSKLLHDQIRENAERVKKREEEMKRRRAEEEMEIQRKLEEELQQLNAVYAKIREEKKKEYDDLIEEATKKFDEEDEKLLEELFNIENEGKDKRKTNR